jgi:hypothetical protein
MSPCAHAFGSTGNPTTPISRYRVGAAPGIRLRLLERQPSIGPFQRALHAHAAVNIDVTPAQRDQFAAAHAGAQLDLSRGLKLTEEARFTSVRNITSGEVELSIRTNTVKRPARRSRCRRSS